jgi:hypothetical protein
MAKTTTKKPADEVEPQVLEEPGSDDDEIGMTDDRNVWMRGLWMLLLAFLFGVGQFLLVIATIVQFLWMLFGKEKNEPIAAFGKDLADWLARTARFQTGATEDKPFPFATWGKQD